MPMGRTTMKALLTTIGSLGDLHPFIAIGQALSARSVDLLFAVPADQVENVRAAGFDAVAILPAFATISASRGLTVPEAARRIVTQRSFVLDAVILPSLAESTVALDRLVDGIDVIVGSIFALAAGIVAEKHGIPLVAINLQPMAMPSRYDPPSTPDTAWMIQSPAGAIGRGWNRASLDLMRAAIRLRYGGAVTRVRRAHGLRPNGRTPIFDPVAAQVATLCCYSPLLAPVQPDAPPGTEAIGFPLFDGGSRGGGRGSAPLDPMLAGFLDGGPPPIVFTLGSFLVQSPGDFYTEAAAAAQALGRRAILLTGIAAPPHRQGEIMTLDYVPHSQLFGRAGLVVHHGGIGTTGQAMRSGVPQLIVPFFGDQFDNAARVSRIGIGTWMRPAQFRGPAAIDALRHLLNTPAVMTRAAVIGDHVRGELAAERAAERIIAAVVADDHDAMRPKRQSNA
jgi:UDP:flavonoid glycosyltransferase YjiC (YdhE family)